MKLITWASIVILTTITLVSSVSAATFNSNLSLGARGDEVKKVQDFLIAQGLLSGVATGYFGNQTRTAIQAFQRTNGLPASGFWFPMTRQKAEIALSKSSISISTTSLNPVANTIYATTTIANEAVLTIMNTTGGTVYSTENNISCYSNEVCKKTLPTNKKIVLQAVQNSGYAFKGWSDVACGTTTECVISMSNNKTISATFEITQVIKNTGLILSVNHPTEICYILPGAEKCNLKMIWKSNFGVGSTKFNIDGRSSYIQDLGNYNFATADYDPKDIASAQAQNASGFFYLGLYAGKHKVLLTADGIDQPIDSVDVEVKCTPGTTWSINRCIYLDGNSLFIFKSNSVVIKSTPEAINCGYTPEMCTGSFSSTTLVTLTAIPRPGHTFGGWTGDCSGKEPTCTLLMNKLRNVGVND